MKVQSTSVEFKDNFMFNTYDYLSTQIKKEGDRYLAQPLKTPIQFRTDIRVPKLGIMFVGWGGNNGTTVTAGILANKHQVHWNTKKGVSTPNFYGSLTQASVVKIGVTGREEVFVPFKDILPMVNPCDITISGWDISKANMAQALKRAEVLDYDLQQKLYPYMEVLNPLPAIYYPDFIAANQEDRADNILQGQNKLEHLSIIRKNIRDFKEQNKLDKVIVLWTANTERFCVEDPKVHGSYEILMKSIEENHPEVAPSQIYCLATILEGCSYINGSPQNTLVKGIIDAAERQKVFVVGDDFKTGQTKFKTALVEFLINAGIKTKSIVSYNHLGNNDGKNLSSNAQFRSKEITKKGCTDDIIQSNMVLYPTEKDRDIDHCIVIKYVPDAGDSKKAMDEYVSEIFLGGNHTLVAYNVCEDSLLAAPLMMDLFLLTELCERINYRVISENGDFKRFDTILSWLAYLCKSPKTEDGLQVVNALSRQRCQLENLLKICAGLTIEDNLRIDVRYLYNQNI